MGVSTKPWRNSDATELQIGWSPVILNVRRKGTWPKLDCFGTPTIAISFSIISMYAARGTEGGIMQLGIMIRLPRRVYYFPIRMLGDQEAGWQLMLDPHDYVFRFAYI